MGPEPPRRICGGRVSLPGMGPRLPHGTPCQNSERARQIGSVRYNSPADPQHDFAAPEPSTRDDSAVSALAPLELLDEVIEERYGGAAWSELQRSLVNRAFPDLARAIRRGTIFSRCARAGYWLSRRPELQRHPYPENIAAEAVEDCLQRFRTRVLPAGQWDPASGVSLENFFTSCCLPDVANRWRWHLRRLPDQPVALEALGDSAGQGLLALTLGRAPDPAETVAERDMVVQILAPLSADDRRSFVLLSAGWTPAEIASTLGIARNTLDVRLGRARKLLHKRRTV